MKTVDAGNVLVFLDVTKTERKRLLAAAENEPVKKKQKMLTVTGETLSNNLCAVHLPNICHSSRRSRPDN